MREERAEQRRAASQEAPVLRDLFDAPQGEVEVLAEPRPTETAPTPPSPRQAPLQTLRQKLHPKRRIGIWLFVALPIFAVLLGLLGLWVTQTALPVPDWALRPFESRANAALGGKLRLSLVGGADLVVEQGVIPRLRLKGVALARADGMPIAALPEVSARPHLRGLLLGRVELQSLTLTGLRVVARRGRDGRFDLELGQGAAATMPSNVPEALALFEAALAAPALAQLERVDLRATEMRVEDQRVNRVWWLREGSLALRQSAEEIRADLRFALQSEAEAAVAEAHFTTQKFSPEARLSAKVSGVPSRDLALQSPALAWLSVLDAPISAEFRAGVDAQGALMPLAAELALGRGALAPQEGAKPVAFESGQVSMVYDPAQGRITVPKLRFDSRSLKLAARASADLGPLKDGLPETILHQIEITDLQVDPEGVFAAPARFTQGGADMRIRLAPFEVELGQLVLVGEGKRIEARGRARAQAEGWDLSFDARMGQIERDAFLKLWPTTFVPKSRRWVTDNIAAGELKNAQFALRLAPKGSPRIALNYEFADASARVVKTLPLTQQTRGFATILDTRHALMIEEGWIPAPRPAGEAPMPLVVPQAERVDVAGSILDVPDIRIKPAPAQVRLHSKGEIPAMLRLLDEPPFKLLQKAGLGTDIATGRAEALTTLDLILKPKIQREELRFKVDARLYDVVSEKLVKGRRIAAEALTLTADTAQIEIKGQGQFDGAGFDGAWRKQFGPEHLGQAQVVADVEVSAERLAQFGVKLPEGMLKGAGKARLELGLRKGQAPRFRASSDLAGMGVTIAGLGWAKPASAKARFVVEGVLPATIEKVTLEGQGLALEGSLQVAGGKLVGAELTRFEQGAWFKGALALKGREITLKGGRLDLRAMAKANDKAAKGGAGYHLSGRLDRVDVVGAINLQDVTLDLETKGGVAGQFSGAVDGGARVEGLLEHGEGQLPVVRVQGADAGAAISAAGIFGKARGGALDLVLQPHQGAYRGQLLVKGTRIKGAGILAQMLAAASVVGLLEQVNGTGVHFGTIQADFTLSEKAVTISRGTAEGATMAVTLSGLYLPRSRSLDMQGVVSPLYVLNGVGQLLSRRGEGLFGFNYTLRGTAADPKIAVNPLSILTPGALRDLLRRKGPTVE